MKKQYYTNKQGKWEKKEGYEVLIQASKEYLAKQKKERLEREDREKIEADKAKRKAEIKQKLQNRTATLEEVEEILEELI